MLFHKEEKTEEYAPWKRHPNPQERRASWISLNGEWSLNGQKINIPFCPESKLSGYSGEITDKKGRMSYKTTFTVDKSMAKWRESRFFLHFDGVDQRFTAVLNGVPVGFHEDGYTKAVFDVTESINKGLNTLKVMAVDRLDKTLPYGKQRKNNGGMWYTTCSGIWKTVWLECVPERHISGLKLSTTLDTLHIRMNYDDFPEESLKIRISSPTIKTEGETDAKEDFATIVTKVNQDIIDKGLTIKLSELKTNRGKELPIKNWSCEEPWLYDITIEAGEDKLESYFGLRTVSIKSVNGINRVMLNDKPVFLHGVLDQGYFMDGLYLPKEEEEYERDILRMKELGFNMLRKHIKTESDWYYYYCDIHGIMIVQDMVNSGVYRYLRDTILPTIGFKIDNAKLRTVSSKRRHNFLNHIKNVTDMLYNHPSIVAYTIFNEGWGQHTSDHYYAYLKELDGSRLIDTTSGWFAGMKSDFDSRHIYFRLRKIQPDKKHPEQPIFVSECGGYSYGIKEHMYNPDKSYGYGACNSVQQLSARIMKLYDEMIIPGIKNGVCGCVYTQVSDIEDEINGMYTYDRELCKVDKDVLNTIRQKINDAFDKV
ncbi:MAG: hypothetical protein MJ124_01510 [Lachnospiraceae bacterium]|nr:hypothetical protein [Lachnospiraceae bacterium]